MDESEVCHLTKEELINAFEALKDKTNTSVEICHGRGNESDFEE